jgi:hypothetical protein
MHRHGLCYGTSLKAMHRSVCIRIYKKAETTRFWKQFDKLKNYEDIAGSATSRKGPTCRL